VEDVAQVGLDGFLAQEQFRGDLRVGLAVDDEPCHLEFAIGQRFDASSAGGARACTAMNVPTELSKLAFCLVPVSERAEGVECRRGELEFAGGTVAVACLGERASREFPRAGRVEQRRNRFERGGRRERLLGGGCGLACVEGECGCGQACHSGCARQRHRVGAGLCGRGGTFGVIQSAGGKQGTGEYLEESRSPASADQPEVLASGSGSQQFDGPVGLPGLEHRGGEHRS